MSLFGRHAREFRKAFARRQWECTPAGLYFPRQHALFRGDVTVQSKHGTRNFPNLMMVFRQDPYSSYWANQFDSILSTGGLAAVLNNKYVTLWGSDMTPSREASMPWVLAEAGGLSEWALYHDMGELGNAPEGYDETDRPAWTWADVGGGRVDNSGSPAAFTMKTASTIAVYGFALCSTQYKHSGRPLKVGTVIPPEEVFEGPSTSVSVFVENYHYPEVWTDGVAPAGSIITAGLGLPLYPGMARVLGADSVYTGDPNGMPWKWDASFTFEGTPINQWYDPSGDDYFDADLGHWVDPSGDDIWWGSDNTDALFAAARFPDAPLLFSDGDPLNVTWGFTLVPA